MLDGHSQGHPVPDELLGPLVECAPPHDDPSALRRVFDAEGYVLLRGALDRDEILAARNEVFSRLGAVREIEPPFDRGIATGASRRRNPCIMHCGHDLGPKTAAMVHIAASGSAYSLANDSTYYGLEDDVITERLPIVHGRIRVPDRPGLGVEIDPEKLARYRIDC